MLVLNFVTGVYFTIRLGFFQFRHLVLLVKNTIVNSFRQKDEINATLGEPTSFQTSMTFVCTIVEFGIIAGGFGVSLWMIIAAMVHL